MDIFICVCVACLMHCSTHNILLYCLYIYIYIFNLYIVSFIIDVQFHVEN